MKKWKINHVMNSKFMEYLIVVLMGTVAFLVIYGPLSLNVTYDKWIWDGYAELDILQFYGGWQLYRDSPWTLPPAVGLYLDYPFGASIAHTATAPLICMILKVFSPILPETFQFLGWMGLLSFVLNGVMGYKIVKLFTGKKLICYLASIFFIVSPIMIERTFRNPALGYQFVILMAIYFYLHSRKHNFKIPYISYLLLNFLTIGIHMYFAPIFYAFLFVNLAERSILKKDYWKNLGYLGIHFIVSIFAFWMTGLFTQSASLGRGFGYFSMNLNALFNPSSKDFIIPDCVLSWSKILPVLPQRYGNYDAFNYLGAGALLGCTVGLIAFIIYLIRSRERGVFKRILKKNWVLLLVCLALTVFSVSNWITFNDKSLAVITLPEKLDSLFSIFRSSGRLFYGVNYLIVITMILLIIRYGGKWRLGILTVLVVLQLYDLSPAFAHKREYFVRYEETGSGVDVGICWMRSEFWDEIGGHYGAITSLSFDNPVPYYIGVYAGSNHLINSITFANRSDENAKRLYIESVKRELEQGNIDADTIYLIADGDTYGQMQPFLRKMDVDVIAVDGIYVIIVPFEGISYEYSEITVEQRGRQE